MKKLIFLVVLIVFFRCSNAESKKYDEKFTAAEDVSSTTDKVSSNNNSYEDIVIQKFQNYIDLLKLKKQHPILKEDADKALENISNQKIISEEHMDFVVSEIYQKGTTEIISDSLQKIKLIYFLKSENKKVKDSVFGYIKSTIITIEDKETKANKITFAKE